MKIRNFHVIVRDGAFSFKSEAHRNAFKLYAKQFEDKEVMLTLTDLKERTRSQSMNNYYWLYLNLIASEKGYTANEVHNWAKQKFLPVITANVFGENVKQEVTTTKLKTSEFMEYLADIESFTEVPRPDTREYWGDSYHK